MRRVLGVLGLALCGCAPAVAVPTSCPELAPKAAHSISPPDASVHRDLGRGSAAFAVSVGDDTGVPLGGRLVRIECSCLDAAVFVVTADDGTARVDGLPAGTYTAALSDPWETRPRTVTVDLPADRTFHLRLEAPAWDLEPAPAEPPDALAPEIVLKVEATGCLGPCRSFVAELSSDDRLRIDEDGGARTRSIEPRAREAALARAACLVAGPSYDEVAVTDFPWLIVRMRRPDGTIAVYRHYAGDPRGTPKRRDFEDELLRALGLHR